MGKAKVPKSALQVVSLHVPRNLYERLVRARADRIAKEGRIVTIKEMVTEALEKSLN